MDLPELHFRRPQRRLVHRCIALVSLLAYVVTTAGIPLPAVAAKGVAKQSFPCQGSSCGCSTAAQCWKSCCCHTPAQRLAWARAHRIQPPAELIAALAQPHVKACCQKRSAVVGNTAHTARVCCASKVNTGLAQSAADQSKAEAGRTQLVYGFMALKCRGLSNQWVTSGAFTPPPTAMVWRPLTTFCQWLIVESDSLALRYDSPPTPPPRLS